MKDYFSDKTFEPGDKLTRGEYENCTFRGCNLAEQDLSEFKFSECLIQEL